MAFPLPPLTLDTVLYLLAGGGMILVALVLLYFDFRSPVHQAFAAFLVVRGIANAMNPWFFVPETLNFAARLQPYFWIAVPFATAFFFIVYRERYGGVRAGVGPMVLLMLGIAAEIAYATDHALFGLALNGPIPANPGPLVLLFVGLPPCYAVVAYLFAKQLRSAPPGPRAQSLMLVSAAFALDPMFFAGVFLARHAAIAVDAGLSANLDLAILGTWLDAATLVLSIFSFTVLLLAWRAASSSRKALGNTWVSRFGFGLALAALTGILSVLELVFEVSATTSAALIFDALWTLALPALVGYALLKHQLFDIDVKVKWTIKRGTLAAMFLAVFFVVAQLAQNFLSDEYGLLVGGVAAGLMLFALSPLQRIAENVADTAMPGVKSFNEMSHPERLEAYLRSARVAWADGAIDRSERAMLDGLRETLGLSLEEATRLESQAAAA